MDPSMVASQRSRDEPSRLRGQVSLVMLGLFFVGILVLKLWVSSQYRFLVWDSYVYLLNARAFLVGYTPYAYFELLRPPLLPFLTSLVWRISGQQIPIAMTISPIFTVGSGLILYRWGSEMFSKTVGVFSAILFLVLPVAFFWTNQILTHGVMIFFLTLTVYSLWRATGGEPKFYLLAGPAAALATLSRYAAVLILPIAATYVMLVMSARGPRKIAPSPNEVKFLVLGFLLFILVWSPWLEWNFAVVSNPFASVLAGSDFFSQGQPTATSGGFLGPWYYYLTDIPSILTVPGAVLLLVGLTSRRLYSDPRVSMILLWGGAFLFFYSLAPVKEDRFNADFVMPFVLIMGLGFERLVTFLGKMRYIRPILFSITAIWLLSLSLTAVQVSDQNAAFNNGYFQDRGLVQVSDWLKSNMNKTDLGATNLGPYLSYYTARNFLALDPILDESQSGGGQLSELLSQMHVKYVVVLSEYGRISLLSGLKTDASLGDFRVFSTEAR